MNERDGLVFACALDGRGGGRALDWKGLRAWKPGRRVLWAHLDRRREDARGWLLEESGLDDTVCDALLAEGSRPHVSLFDGGMMVILRGVNLNPGADPEDMVSLRMWIDRGRVITLRSHKVMAVEDLRQAIGQGSGPLDQADLVARMAARLIDRMRPVITALHDDVDALEGQALRSTSRALRHHMYAIRHKVIELRRHIAPQRDAMAQLIHENVAWLDRLDRARLREITDRLARFIDDLDTARDRAGVVQEELSARLAEETNRAMYVLSIVATVFLPLGFLTGLLGVNVGGIPMTQNPWGFGIVCGVLLLVGLVEFWLFRRLKWL